MSDVAVIGAGPAGMAACIYLRRADVDVTVFEKNEIGGLLLNAYLVENYPGFPEGIKGTHLCDLMKQQLKIWDIEPVREDIKQIIVDEKNNFILLTSRLQQSEFNAVILAAGTEANELDIPGEKDMKGRQLFYEIKYLLPEIKSGDKCTVIGGGDAAFDYSLNLAEHDIDVDLCFRSGEPGCLPLLKQRVQKHTRIHLHPLFIPVRIQDNRGKPVLSFSCLRRNKNMRITSDYILIACGRTPNNKLFPSGLEPGHTPGLYLAGDIVSGRFRQTGIAVGSGILAAMNTEIYLKEYIR